MLRVNSTPSMLAICWQQNWKGVQRPLRYVTYGKLEYKNKRLQMIFQVTPGDTPYIEYTYGDVRHI